MDVPMRKENYIPPNSNNLGRDNGIDEDGHYDETKDHNGWKRLKKENPKAYDELMKFLEKSDSKKID